MGTVCSMFYVVVYAALRRLFSDVIIQAVAVRTFAKDVVCRFTECKSLIPGGRKKLKEAAVSIDTISTENLARFFFLASRPLMNLRAPQSRTHQSA